MLYLLYFSNIMHSKVNIMHSKVRGFQKYMPSKKCKTS